MVGEWARGSAPASDLPRPIGKAKAEMAKAKRGEKAKEREEKRQSKVSEESLKAETCQPHGYAASNDARHRSEFHYTKQEVK